MTIGERMAGPVNYILTACKKRDKTDTALKAAFLILQMADLALTLYAARYGYPELNPFMKASLDSVQKLAIFKFIVPVAISWFVPGRLLIPAILLMGVVVGWNVKELLCLWF